MCYNWESTENRILALYFHPGNANYKSTQPELKIMFCHVQAIFQQLIFVHDYMN